MTDEYANQPPVSEWKFIELLKAPLHTKTKWRRLKKKKNEINLADGVALEFKFPDPDGKLVTIYNEFNNFLEAGNIKANGAYKIITEFTPTSVFEEFIFEGDDNSCRLRAADTEGIRRALVFLEDRITSAGGPFLTTGKARRKPFIKTRISRCFFGPIKRPPMNRDELMDHVNYYPDEYLNRLVHEGINGLWLSIEFRDICPSRFFPKHGRNAQKQLKKLRQTVQHCARYGIKIYVYCNEPLMFSDKYLPVSDLKKHPYFAGHAESYGKHFCTSSREGREYLEECTNFIFSNVPELGGMICITFGEKPTSCYSSPQKFFDNNCPRCSKRKPWEVYHDTLAAMAKGVKKAAPDAEFISWLYAPGSLNEESKEIIRRIAEHTPRDVVMQYNFESNGKVKQLGRELLALDYWLAWPGPSDIFTDCAKAAINAGARASAKIQVGCSHENATIPFMPVPGSLYQKYKAMKKLGVSSVMQCWYFGNYPGLMNKAAGELSFLPFPETENEFLEKLALCNWPGNHKKVVRAWKYFMKGYSNFPITLSFTWSGPLHCSIVWPLHLMPVDQPIAPSWKFGYPDSGDRIGECICFNHSLDETLTLLERMDKYWQNGVAILSDIEKDYTGNHDRLMDITLGKAIGLQINSTKNIFTFYDLREKLPFLSKNEQLDVLKKMSAIVRAEIKNSGTMRKLCLKDPRLGFHSEAEGYKFFPAKLEWRADLLKKLLKTEFPKVRSDIKKSNKLFPEYTGIAPRSKSYICDKQRDVAPIEKFQNGEGSWKAWKDGKNLHFEVKWTPETHGNNRTDGITLSIEPRRLWPCIRFGISADGRKTLYIPAQGSSKAYEWNCTQEKSGKSISTIFSIPIKTIPWYDGKKPLRINIHNEFHSGWIKKNPLPSRLLFSTENSADLGWFFIKKTV